MTEYTVVFPADFDDYAWEVESKGWVSGVLLQAAGRMYLLTVYDKDRLAQEIEDELQRGDVFFEPNLLIVESVNRENHRQSCRSVGEVRLGPALGR